MLAVKNALRICDGYAGSAVAKISQHSKGIVMGTSSGFIALLSAGAGTNWTPVYASTDITAAGPGLMYAFALLLDMMTGMGNWYIQNAMGQLYIAMACLMFVFILIKSLFRHSGGKKR